MSLRKPLGLWTFKTNHRFPLLAQYSTQQSLRRQGEANALLKRFYSNNNDWEIEELPHYATFRSDLEQFLSDRIAGGLTSPSELERLVVRSWQNLIDALDESWRNYLEYRAVVEDLKKPYVKSRRSVKNLDEEPRMTSDFNTITYKWDPEQVNLRQIAWLMDRKRRILKEGKIDSFMFEYEMKELAKLRRRELEKQSK